MQGWGWGVVGAALSLGCDSSATNNGAASGNDAGGGSGTVTGTTSAGAGSGPNVATGTPIGGDTSSGGSSAGGASSGTGGNDTKGSESAGAASGGTASGATAAGGNGNSNEAGGGATSTGGSPNTPSGGGIAARHPGDEGIESDPDVIFADDFEAYADPAELNDRWSAVYQNEYVTFATDPANVYAGSQALELTLPQQDAELSDAVDKEIEDEQDVLFLRYYSKFFPPYDVVGSSHNGSSISAHYFNDGQATPGVPADGTNKFLVNLEHWRGEEETASPGFLNVYVYHPEQRSQWGDHFFPTGQVLPYSADPFDFGPDFMSRPDHLPELDRWYCYEYMVKANTVGERDGQISIWLDGELVADFQNLRFRDVDSLKINRFGLSFHIGSNPNGEGKKWYDNVVAARSYIGPLAE